MDTKTITLLAIVMHLSAVIGIPARSPNVVVVVGCDDALPGEVPYQVSLQDTSYGFPYHFCGASVYSPGWVITAAHCVHGRQQQHLQIVAGVVNLDIDGGSEQVIPVSQIIQHEQYHYNSLSNDVALLKLTRPLDLNQNVKVVQLPEAGHRAAGLCTVSGWGYMKEGGRVSSLLQKVMVPIVSDEECRKSYGADQIEDSMVCAGLPEGGKDSCLDDSGGPLVCRDSDTSYLAGVVSSGLGCARPGFPGIYTEVTYYIDWIKDNAV